MSLYGGSVVSRLSKRSAIRYATGSKVTLCLRVCLLLCFVDATPPTRCSRSLTL